MIINNIAILEKKKKILYCTINFFLYSKKKAEKSVTKIYTAQQSYEIIVLELH